MRSADTKSIQSILPNHEASVCLKLIPISYQIPSPSTNILINQSQCKCKI
jgi:hypothetical protein